MAIIVGDIHGNVEKVQAFLQYKPEEVHVALGDYLDSFFEPQGRQLLALQLLLDSKAILLWGNHDLHYLEIPPWVCTGFQYGKEKPLQNLIEANKKRFLAAYSVDGWLCTHAGCHVRMAKHLTNPIEIAEKLNATFTKWLTKATCFQHPTNGWLISGIPSIFHIGQGRGGEYRNGGIFWFDFKRESGLAPIKQIFGHSEVKEPVLTETYVLLDTSNNKNNCWIYDTSTNELIDGMKYKVISSLKVNDTVNNPRRLCDLPECERESFEAFLTLRCCPLIEGVPENEQDGYWPADYREWQADRKAREEHALKTYSRLRDLPEEEQRPFWEWMLGQTRPGVEGYAPEDQDFYYPWDYEQWKAGLPTLD